MRQQAIDPIIGTLKADNLGNRCHLKDQTGDEIRAVLCAAGYNFKWLLRMTRKSSIVFVDSSGARILAANLLERQIEQSQFFPKI